jgi:hypothetical protein
MSGICELDAEQAVPAVVIVSGRYGQRDLGVPAAHEGYELTVLSFDYGQRHKREVSCALVEGTVGSLRTTYSAGQRARR